MPCTRCIYQSQRPLNTKEFKHKGVVPRRDIREGVLPDEEYSPLAFGEEASVDSVASFVFAKRHRETRCTISVRTLSVTEYEHIARLEMRIHALKLPLK